MSLDTALDELFGLPAGEFIGARDKLAAQLKADGDQDGAKTVKKLKKPTVAAWAVNQLPAHAPEPLQALLDADANLRKGHEGGLTVAGLQEAMQARQRAIQALVKAAAKILDEAGHSSNAATLNKITRTLEALTAEEDERPGRLQRELEPKGFEALAGFALAAPKPAPRAVPAVEAEPDAEPDRAAPFREASALAKRELMRAQTEALEAKQSLESAQRRAALAATALNAAREKSDAAEAALEEQV